MSCMNNLQPVFIQEIQKCYHRSIAKREHSNFTGKDNDARTHHTIIQWEQILLVNICVMQIHGLFSLLAYEFSPLINLSYSIPNIHVMSKLSKKKINKDNGPHNMVQSEKSNQI